jgi:hypothetical protein
MIRRFLLRCLGLQDYDARIRDLEKHFVTKRDGQGKPVETLADVPINERSKLKQPTGMTWSQRKAWLERTEGGRLLG